MKSRDQRSFSPTPSASPRSIQNDIIQASAQRVVRRTQLLYWNSFRPCFLLEQLDLLNRALRLLFSPIKLLPCCR